MEALHDFTLVRAELGRMACRDNIILGFQTFSLAINLDISPIVHVRDVTVVRISNQCGHRLEYCDAWCEYAWPLTFLTTHYHIHPEGTAHTKVTSSLLFASII